MEGNGDNITIVNNQGVAELIGVPGNIENSTLKKHFPFIDKVMAFSNLSEDDILDEKDLLIIKNIHKRSKMTRYQKQRHYSRVDHTNARAYLTANITLGRNGELVKRILGSYKVVSVNSSDGPQKRSMLGSVLHRGGQS